MTTEVTLVCMAAKVFEVGVAIAGHLEAGTTTVVIGKVFTCYPSILCGGMLRLGHPPALYPILCCCSEVYHTIL